MKKAALILATVAALAVAAIAPASAQGTRTNYSSLAAFPLILGVGYKVVVTI
jgi:hypothetical protein